MLGLTTGKLVRWARDGLIMVVIALVMLALLELGLRVYVGPPAFQYDPELIASLAPSVSKVYVRSVDGGPHFIRWETNDEGFRGPPLDPAADQRVIVFGDSNVQARFSTQELSFTGQLERLLEEPTGKNVEVINAGVVGFGPDQSLIRMRSLIERYEPDALVFHLFTENDFGDIVRNRLFELDPSGKLVRTPHPVTPDERMPTGWWSRPPGELLRNSMISIFANAYAQGLARSKQPHPELEHDPERFRRGALGQHERELAVYQAGAPRKYSMFSDHYEADIAFAPDGESARLEYALLRAVLEQAGRIASDHSLPFLVVIQPASRDLTTNLPNHHRVLEDIPGYDRRRLDSWMESICRELGLDFVNLFDVFEATGRPNEMYFPTPDPHWNEAGQRVAAESVAEKLLPAMR